MSSLARKLAVTIAVPLALYFASEHLFLPGIDAEALAKLAGGSTANLGVFALGVMPFVSAYWIVEVAAFFVPRWSRLRHGNPEGRAKLELAAAILAILLALFQSFGIATQLRALDGVGNLAFTVSVPLVMLSLVGGLCVQFVAARFVSQRGLGNGFVVLLAASNLPGLVEGFLQDAGLRPRGAPEELGVSSSRELALKVIGLAIGILATWIVLGRPSAAPRAPAGEDGEDGASPYRGARQLVVSPWIPIPASSLQPIAFGVAVLALPLLLSGLNIRAPGLVAFVNDAYVPLEIVLTALALLVFARQMHRPQELSDLALRLRAKARGKMPDEIRAALRRSLVPTGLYLLAVAASAHAARVHFVLVPVLAAVGIDLVRSARLEVSAPGLVAVWEERRASAVPVLRAALAADGIESEARGLAVLGLWQVFAPYAPVQILVAQADAARATQTLRHWLLGEERPERAATATEAPLANEEGKPPWAPARRNVVLALCSVAALLCVFAASHAGSTPLPSGPRPELEVVRVDDTIDPFEQMPESAMPVGEGIEIRIENVRGGSGSTAKVNFARLTLREGETATAGGVRLRRWLSTIALPPGARFGIEPDEDGVRSFVLIREPILRTEDVTEAVAVRHDEEMSVSVTLSDSAAQRFEDATREWTNRRIAIVLDGVINSAPVVRTAIGGGRVSITMGAGDPDKAKENALRLAAGLRGR